MWSWHDRSLDPIARVNANAPQRAYLWIHNRLGPETGIWIMDMN